MGDFAVNVAIAYQIGGARGDHSICFAKGSSFQHMTHPLPVLLLFRDAALAVHRHEMPCFHELCNMSVKARRPRFIGADRGSPRVSQPTLKHLRLLRASR